jgi:hypothetical protein
MLLLTIVYAVMFGSLAYVVVADPFTDENGDGREWELLDRYLESRRNR